MRERAGQRQGVFALDPEPGVEDPLRPSPVVREDQEALAVLVEPSHRVEPPTIGDERGRNEVDHRRRCVTILGRRGHPGRFVEQEVRGPGGIADRQPVHEDVRLLRVDLLAE